MSILYPTVPTAGSHGKHFAEGHLRLKNLSASIVAAAASATTAADSNAASTIVVVTGIKS